MPTEVPDVVVSSRIVLQMVAILHGRGFELTRGCGGLLGRLVKLMSVFDILCSDDRGTNDLI